MVRIKARVVFLALSLISIVLLAHISHWDDYEDDSASHMLSRTPFGDASVSLVGTLPKLDHHNASSVLPVALPKKSIALTSKLQNTGSSALRAPSNGSSSAFLNSKIKLINVSRGVFADVHDNVVLHRPEVPLLSKSKHETRVDTRKLTVYMDWGRGNLAFTLSNYRSLESILSHMPNVKLRVATIAPTSAAMYRYANTLSWTQFKKYLKRGYVFVRIIIYSCFLSNTTYLLDTTYKLKFRLH